MKKALTFVSALTISILSIAQGLPQLPNDPATKVGKLDNGLTYYIRHNDKPAQRAEFYLATNAGAIQETPEQDGLAHFLEHMCFNGTKNFPGKGILNYLESIGASFGGNVNASTGIEQTVYMLTNIPLINPSVIDSCLLIIHDYSHFVTCDPKEIDAERGVIIEEKRTRNTADWRNFMASNKYLFKGTPYAEETLIGTEEQLKGFAYHNLTDFYHTWYRPDMQAVIVVGDINVDETEAKLKSIFSDIPAAENPKAKEIIRIVPNEEPIVGIISDPETSASSIEIVWKSEARPTEYNSTPIALMQDVIEEIAYNAMAERFQEITSKADAKFLSGMFAMGEYNNIMDVVIGRVGFKDGEAVPAFEAFMTEIERLRRYGITEGELERAKTEFLADAESAAKKAETRKNNEFVQPLINNFFKNKAFMEPSVRYQVLQSIMPQISSEIVNKVIAEGITKDNIVIIYSGPAKDGLKNPEEAELKAVLANVAAAEIARPAGEEIPTEFLDESALKGSKARKVQDYIYGSKLLTLKNGIRIVLYPTDVEKDKISIKLWKKGGMSLIDDDELYSLEDNIYGLLNSNSGVSKFPASTLAKMLSGKKVSASPFISGYTHGINIGSTSKDIETALQLGYLIFTDNRFDEEEYNKGIKQIEAVLPNLEKNPDFKLQQALKSTLFDSPRSRIMISRETIDKASLKTIEAVHKRLFDGAATTNVVIAGDFKIEEMTALAEKYFGSIRKGGKKTDWKYRGDGIVSDSRINDFKTQMEAPKTSVLQVYKVDKPFSIEDKAAYEAFSYIMNMVYTESLREEEGGTYGASAHGQLNNSPNEFRLFQVYFDTNDAQSGRLRELAIKGIRDIAENGPDAVKYDKAVKNLQKRIPESKLRVNYWRNAIETYMNYGYDSIDEYEKAVNALTPEKVKAVASELINQGKMSEIIMRGEN